MPIRARLGINQWETCPYDTASFIAVLRPYIVRLTSESFLISRGAGTWCVSPLTGAQKYLNAAEPCMRLIRPAAHSEIILIGRGRDCHALLGLPIECVRSVAKDC